MGMFDETLEQEFKRYSELEEYKDYLEARMTEIEQQVLLALASGGAGGIAGKFLEYSCDAGKRFLSGYFRDHGEAITKAGEDNFTNYLTELIKEVRKLESDQKIFEERFNDTLGQPSFAALLQKSVIGSAKTGSKEKHKILARLIAERILEEEESTFSLNSESYVETILRMNKWHFLFLKFIKIIDSLSSTEFLETSYIENDEIHTAEGCLNKIYKEIDNKISRNSKPEVEMALLIGHLEENKCLVYRPTRQPLTLEKAIFNPNSIKILNVTQEKAKSFLESEDGRKLELFYRNAYIAQFKRTVTGIMLSRYL